MCVQIFCLPKRGETFKHTKASFKCTAYLKWLMSKNKKIKKLPPTSLWWLTPSSLFFVCVQSAALDRVLSEFRCICGEDAISLAEAVRVQHGRDESVHRSYTPVILHHISHLTKHKNILLQVGLSYFQNESLSTLLLAVELVTDSGLGILL